MAAKAYYYSLLDAAEKGIIAYHWHPHGNVAFPHLHIGSGARVGRVDLRNAHIPTGRIAMENLLRMVITEFGVAPRRGDWPDVLAQSQKLTSSSAVDRAPSSQSALPTFPVSP
ncbi:hypothetical protein SBA4_3010004 [Candidatus Sulfopaludibacter sp. SbA4]|nr:hypothetical protein SBA4_3010004 [Candidatus Sulfopaludibacter sp. SbA4]